MGFWIIANLTEPISNNFKENSLSLLYLSHTQNLAWQTRENHQKINRNDPYNPDQELTWFRFKILPNNILTKNLLPNWCLPNNILPKSCLPKNILPLYSHIQTFYSSVIYTMRLTLHLHNIFHLKKCNCYKKIIIHRDLNQGESQTRWHIKSFLFAPKRKKSWLETASLMRPQAHFSGKI